MPNDIPVDTSDWGIDLRRLSTDIPYREACYRAADPDLSLEDSLEGTAKKLLKHHGYRVANIRGVRVHQLLMKPPIYREIAALVDEKKVTFANAGIMIEKLESDDAVFAWNMEKLATVWGFLITGTADDIDKAIDTLIAENPKALQDYRGGKLTAIGSLVGSIMKSTKGLNPASVKERLTQRLDH